MISAEQYKQTLIWYYLYQIEEVRAYIEEIYLNASDLVTKKCEEENYFGGYLDSEIKKLENNQCISNLTYLFNVTSNATFVNDTMDVLLDFMGEIDYVNATVVNQKRIPLVVCVAGRFGDLNDSCRLRSAWVPVHFRCLYATAVE
jgi:hypothetical protein